MTTSGTSIGPLLARRETHLPVNEVFGPTVQGEGPHTGRVVSFVRLGLCNLSCGFCDSASTWDDSRYDLAAWNPSTPVSSVVEDVAQRGAPVTVLSGGEPLMQQTRPAFTTMLDGLAAVSSVHVETNGTISPTRYVADRVSWFSVSPKLANNGSDPVGKRLKSSVLARFAALADQRRACFKFVINSPEDLDEVDALARELSLAPDQVWIMPEGVSPESVLARHRRLAEHIITRGYSTSTRLHTLMWGDERGR